MAKKIPELYPALPNNTTSSDNEIPHHLKLTEEERTYGTIPGSSVATVAAQYCNNLAITKMITIPKYQ